MKETDYVQNVVRKANGFVFMKSGNSICSRPSVIESIRENVASRGGMRSCAVAESGDAYKVNVTCNNDEVYSSVILSLGDVVDLINVL